MLSLGVLQAVLPVSGAIPLGIPSVEEPLDVKAAALAELGRKLFFDKRLSTDGSISCATCHVPERGFTDGRPTARGLHGAQLTRHTPSLLNVRYASVLFWDGRAKDLEEQVRSPLLAPAEHALREEQVGQIVRSDPGYAAAFSDLLNAPANRVSVKEVSAAIAAYERTLTAGDSPFDRYEYGHDPKAMSVAAVRGLALFRGRAGCSSCHTIGQESALFTDGDFHASALELPRGTVARLGELAKRVTALRTSGDVDALNALLETDAEVAALGRFVVTMAPRDIGSFKTPSLRNVAETGPYMHDGSVATLERAVDLELYSRTSQRYPLVITEDERSDLLQFLAALSSPNQSNDAQLSP